MAQQEKVKYQTEDEKSEKAQHQGDYLQHEKQALTQRLCELNVSIAEIQQIRTDSYYQQIRHRYDLFNMLRTFLLCFNLALVL